MKTKEGTKRRQKAPLTKRPGDARRALRAFESLYCGAGGGPTLEGNPLPRLWERRERVNQDDARACARDTEACSESIWGLQMCAGRDDGQIRARARAREAVEGKAR